MNLEFDSEQEALRATTRSLLAASYDTVAKRNAIAETELGWDREVWASLADIGILGVPFAAEYEGIDAGPEELLAVMLEVGRVLAPEPLVDAVYLPGGLVAKRGADGQRSRILPQLVNGKTLLAFAHEEPGSRWPDIAVETRAEQSGDAWTVSGRKSPVAAGDSADTLVVSAQLPSGGVGLFLVAGDAAGVTRRAYRTHDERRGADISFESSPAEPLGEASDASSDIAEAYVRAQMLQCGEAVGAMEEALRITVEYLKQRVQFGAPIARFEALQHRASDAYSSVETARSITILAAVTLSDGVVDPIVASRAKLLVGRCARHVGQEAVQMHGGIGITAEYPISHYLSRLTAITHSLGSTEDHLRVLASAVAA